MSPSDFSVTPENIRAFILPDDWPELQRNFELMADDQHSRQFEFRIRQTDGQIRWCMASAAATVNEGGKVIRISGVTFDITNRKHAEEKQALLAREVDHRAKNALSLVQAILRLTRAEDVGMYVKSVEGRIRALSYAHNLLSQSRWLGANLQKLVEEELAPYRGPDRDRIRYVGPSVTLTPAAAQTLALAIHELATNAAKYGALSGSDGRLQVQWTIDREMLLLEWRETGADALTKPRTTGFGTKIIVASIEQQLRGSVVMEWKPEGLICILSTPAVGSVEDGGDDVLNALDTGVDAQLNEQSELQVHREIGR